MVLRRRIFFIGLLVHVGLVVAACTPIARVIHHFVESGSAVEPTSIILRYRTPRPSETPRVIDTPTPTATRNLDPDYYYGGLTVTMDDVGRIVPLRKGQNFSLYLGGDYIWQVESDPDYLISQNLKITPAPGEAGIFIARERGEGILKAVGEPTCRQAHPPCERPSILFHVSVVIE